MVADVIIITITDVEFLIIPADVFSISIHLIADVAMWHLTRVAVAIIVIVTITAAVIITTADVMMLHRSPILAETTADVTEIKMKMSEGIGCLCLPFYENIKLDKRKNGGL